MWIQFQLGYNLAKDLTLEHRLPVGSVLNLDGKFLLWKMFSLHFWNTLKRKRVKQSERSEIQLLYENPLIIRNYFLKYLFQVVLPNINKTSMQAVLDYLYTKQLSSSQELDTLELIALANRFCLPHLIALAGNNLWPCPMQYLLQQLKCALMVFGTRKIFSSVRENNVFFLRGIL